MNVSNKYRLINLCQLDHLDISIVIKETSPALARSHHKSFASCKTRQRQIVDVAHRPIAELHGTRKSLRTRNSEYEYRDPIEGSCPEVFTLQTFNVLQTNNRKSTMSSTLTLKEYLNTLKGFPRRAYYRVRNPTISQDVLLFLIAFRILNAFCIKTFFQPDEFFQSLEPAWEIAFGAGSGAWITWVRSSRKGASIC